MIVWTPGQRDWSEIPSDNRGHAVEEIRFVALFSCDPFAPFSAW